MESTPEQLAEGLAIVRVLSAVLDRLVIANAPIARVDSGHVTKFHAMKVPGIGIQQYLERIHKYASCSNECFILALIYIDRLIQRNNFLLSELNVHRVVITSIVLAAKFFDDAYYNNAYYAKVGGVLVSEMNGLEVDFLFRINFSLHVTPEEFDKYRAELLSQVSAVAQLHPAPIPAPLHTQQLQDVQINACQMSAPPSNHSNMAQVNGLNTTQAAACQLHAVAPAPQLPLHGAVNSNPMINQAHAAPLNMNGHLHTAPVAPNLHQPAMTAPPASQPSFRNQSFPQITPSPPSDAVQGTNGGLDYCHSSADMINAALSSLAADFLQQQSSGSFPNVQRTNSMPLILKAQSQVPCVNLMQPRCSQLNPLSVSAPADSLIQLCQYPISGTRGGDEIFLVDSNVFPVQKQNAFGQCDLGACPTRNGDNVLLNQAAMEAQLLVAGHRHTQMLAGAGI